MSREFQIGNVGNVAKRSESEQKSVPNERTKSLRIKI
jgi:hypothetical protein